MNRTLIPIFTLLAISINANCSDKEPELSPLLLPDKTPDNIKAIKAHQYQRFQEAQQSDFSTREARSEYSRSTNNSPTPSESTEECCTIL